MHRTNICGLNLAPFVLSACLSFATAQTPLTNGLAHSGSILSAGASNLWVFTANAGQSIILRCGKVSGTATFGPLLLLSAPDGSLVFSNSHASDAYIAYRTTNSGTFTVTVASSTPAQTGNYQLHFIQIPGAFQFPPGTGGGSLTNGARFAGTNALGDEDVWTLSANTDDTIVLRAAVTGGTPFYGPWVQLYGPNGQLVSEVKSNGAGELEYRTTNSGPFTVLVGSSGFGQSGSYLLKLAQVPGSFVIPSGDSGGALTNGGNLVGTNGPAGLDMWTLNANVGESVILRCAILSSSQGSYNPYVRVYGPDGARVTSAVNFVSESIVSFQPTNSGTFTALVGPATPGFTGSYTLRYVKIPGAFVIPPNDQGGPLTNGAAQDGVIDLGDEDMWTVSATKGETLAFRGAKTAGAGSFFPNQRLYGPDGKLLITYAENNLDNFFTYQTTNSGTFTLVVDSAFPGYTGSYRLRLAQIPRTFVVPPGDGGGALVNGVAQDAPLALGGLNLWTFAANKGDGITLTITNLSGNNFFSPQTFLYGPDGTRLYGRFVANGIQSNTAPSLGTYTVLASSAQAAGSGTYRLRLDKYPPDLSFPLQLGSTVTNHFTTSGDRAYYMVTIPPGGHLQLTLRELDHLGANEVYVRRGAPPTPGSYDYRYPYQAADQQILIPNADAGDWYVLVVGAQVPGSGQYTLRADLLTGLVLQSVSPNPVGNATPATMVLNGAGFDNTTQILLQLGATTVRTGTVLTASSGRLLAQFQFQGVSSNTYQLTASQAGTSASLPLQVIQGGGGQLDVQLIVPSNLGRHAPGTLILEYANIGTGSMPAPLLVVHSLEHALMGLDASLIAPGIWSPAVPPGFSDTLQILASGAVPGALQPGERLRVPIYYIGLPPYVALQNPSLHFQLGSFDASNPLPVGWANLKDELRPDGIPATAWDAVWANFLAGVGSTWGQYAAMLSDNASYLGRLGFNVIDVSQLLRFKLAQADGLNPVALLASSIDAKARAPGIDLAFERVFPQRLSQRYRLGPLGWGWSHNWEFHAQTDTNGNLVVLGPAGLLRVFHPDVRGGFFAFPGDHGTLTTVGGGYQITELDGRKMVFRSDGLLDHVEDLNGNRITAAYTGGLLTRLIHSSGQNITLAYAGSLVQSVTDPYGRVTSFAYDTEQQLTSATSYGTNTFSYTYSAGLGVPRDHALLSVTSPAGARTVYTFDAQGRVASRADQGGGQVTFTYDSAGTVFARDSLTNTTAFYYDQRARLTKVVDPLGHAVRWTFDNDSNITSLQGPAGHTATATFDAQDEPTTVLDPQGGSTSLSYTSYARLQRLTDPLGRSTMFAHDALGNLTSMVYPNGSSLTLSNDVHGELVSYKNRRGQNIQLTRDAFGRITRKATPEGRTCDFVYDVHGNLTNVVDSLLGTTTLTYDDHDQVIQITYPGGKGFSFAYDADGRRTQRTSSDGHVLKYFYDAAARLEHLEDGSGQLIVRYSYDPAGRPVREDKGNHTSTTYEHDAGGNLLQLSNYGAGGILLSQFEYTHDANGQRTSMISSAGTSTYAYDGRGQLASVTYPDAHHVEYQYDRAGNRTQVTDQNAISAYTVGLTGEYLQVGSTNFTYDADGNLTNQVSAAGNTRYQYDSESRLVSVTTPDNSTWQYTYDAFGKRVAVTHNGQMTQYLHDFDGLGNIVAEYDGAGQLLARYDHGLGLVSRSDPAGASYYYDYDALGNTRELTDAQGAVVNHYDYDVYGASVLAQGTVPNPFGFIGRDGVLDDASGLLYMRARSYSPGLGRFVQNDPVGLLASLSPYSQSYALNDPVNHADPSGLDTSLDAWSEESPLYNPNTFGNSATFAIGAEALEQQAQYAGASKLLEGAGRSLGFASAYLYWEQGQHIRGAYEFTKATTVFIASAVFGRFNPMAGAACEWVLGESYETLTDVIGIIAYGGFFSFDYISDVIQQWDYYEWLITNYLSDLIPWENLQNISNAIADSFDPNGLVGPAGFGPLNYLGGDGLFAYRINFQNATNATAPAQVVVITNTLDPNLDISTLEFVSAGFGDHVIAIPPGTQHYEHTESMIFNGTTFNVNLEAKVDPIARQVQVQFNSLMPDTGLPPTIDVGFLPPEDGTFRGDGHIAYVVRPLPGLTTGTEIRNIGLVTFDPLAGGPTFRSDLVDPTDPKSGINTNRQALVTIDADIPTSSVNALPASSGSPDINVSWAGADVGSGITGYDVYLRTDNGPWTLWQANVTNTSAVWQGDFGHNYAFVSAAHDGAGNTEAAPSSSTPPDAQTSVTSQSPDRLEIATINSTGIEFKFLGSPGVTWHIQRATAINGAWTDLGTLTIGAEGTGSFEEANPPAGGAFYRGFRP